MNDKYPQIAISMLRQWLNEERIKDVKNFVTNEELSLWLNNEDLETKNPPCEVDS